MALLRIIQEEVPIEAICEMEFRERDEIRRVVFTGNGKCVRESESAAGASRTHVRSAS